MIAIRRDAPGDEEHVRAILVASGFDPELADRGTYYTRLVAVDDDGTVLGFLDGKFGQPVPFRPQGVQGAHPGPQAWGNLMAVAPEARRRGVGTALLRAFLVEAQQHGCTFFAAMVSWADDHTDRVAFFNQCGLGDLAPDTPDELVGAAITDILTATSVV